MVAIVACQIERGCDQLSLSLAKFGVQLHNLTRFNIKQIRFQLCQCRSNSKGGGVSFSYFH